MTVALLIQALVHQTTILIAQLATSGRGRAPIAEVANQVFLDLVRELERQGVSRKVSADMFGMGLRTYQRKIQRITESSTDRGRTLWSAMLDYLRERESVARKDVLDRFDGDDEALVKGVLYDLCENGLVVQSGTAAASVYRAASEDEIGRLWRSGREEGLEELFWALIYHQGPLRAEELAERTRHPVSECEKVLGRLVASGRVDAEDGSYRASSLVLPLGSPVGFEAAVLDHFRAVVTTLAARLRAGASATSATDRVGGSTYTFAIWPGHPLEEEAHSTLGSLRARIGDLRRRVEAYNALHERPEDYEKMVLYFGQAAIREGRGSSDDE
jgi:hypothetical protein